MSGAEALRQIEVAAQREIVLNAALVARALNVSRRHLLRDWASRGLPKITIGYTTLLPIDDVCRAYFDHLICHPITSGLSVTVSHSRQSASVSSVILGPARSTRHMRSTDV